MQTLNWYYKRLKAMSPGEVAWRMRSSLRDRIDRLVVNRRQQLRPLSAILNDNATDNKLGLSVCDVSLAQWAKSDAGDLEKAWYDSLLTRAEQIADHRLDYFDQKNMHLGDPIVWNRDHKRNQNTPMTYCSALDYRDVNESGDCKFVWEPNRHHQLVVLARAYRTTGDIRFANAVAEQLTSWLDQNPFGLGMNWRSGLELGIRLINWVWALDLIEGSGAIDDKLNHRILDSVARHIWEIDRKYSQGSSVNNHLIGEAAGVFVAASYFTNLKNASKWQAKSQAILAREILAQSFPDGGINPIMRIVHSTSLKQIFWKKIFVLSIYID